MLISLLVSTKLAFHFEIVSIVKPEPIQMNGPQRTACLAKGYTYSYVANIMSTVRGSVPRLQY